MIENDKQLGVTALSLKDFEKAIEELKAQPVKDSFYLYELEALEQQAHILREEIKDYLTKTR